METYQDFKLALMGIRARKRLIIPNTKLELDIRILSSHEVLDAQSAKSSFLESRKLLSDRGCNILEENIQTIFRACLRPDTDVKLFEDPGDVRELPQEYIAYLAEQYMILSDRNNPAIKDLTSEEIQHLKKKLLSGDELIGLNYFQLVSLCKHLADSLVISGQPANSSSDAHQETSPTPSGSSTPPSTMPSSESLILDNKPPKIKVI